MADTVTSQKLKDHATAWAYKFTNESDGTGETNVLKVDVSGLTAASNSALTNQRVNINKLAWSIAGANSKVRLMWSGDNSPNTIVVLTGSGTMDLATNLTAPLTNNIANTNGDILLSTLGFVNGASYTIIVEGKKTAGFTSRETTDDGESP
jgi:hypothetical protein